MVLQSIKNLARGFSVSHFLDHIGIQVPLEKSTIDSFYPVYQALSYTVQKDNWFYNIIFPISILTMSIKGKIVCLQ
jgi:hypothetical protein